VSASRIHAVIAAGLASPPLLERWQREPHLLRDYGVDPASLDLTTLWKFAGLSIKVRHGALQADLPLTFRFLNVAGLEIEVFASYGSSRAAEQRSYAGTPLARAHDVVTFLERWLDFEKHEHVLLWDLVRHELALAQLSAIAPDVAATGKRRRANGGIDAACVPAVTGDVILHPMHCDTAALAAMLREKSPRLNEIALDEAYVCYWRAPELPEIRVLKLDELGFYLLTLVDGVLPLAALSERLGCGSLPPRQLMLTVKKLRELGVLSFTKGRGRKG
jgi:hypothetical protein